MESTEQRYVQFPLYLLQHFITNKNETINNILLYGAYRFSTKINYEPENVANQLIYALYSNKLTKELKKAIESLQSEILGLNDDYKCFDGNGNFEPDEFEVQEVLEAFENNEKFYTKAIEYYQIHIAIKLLKIKCDVDFIIKNGLEVQKQIINKEPFPMVSVSLLFEFRDNEKTDFEIMQFLAYIAINSILGTKAISKTNKLHTISRMLGYSSTKHLPDKLNATSSELVKKYKIRYHFSKLIKHLELNWNIRTYSNHIRGFYVAKSKVSLDELALIAETNKLKNKVKKLENEKKEAKRKALERLKR